MRPKVAASVLSAAPQLDLAATYWRDGYVVIRGLLPAELADALAAAFEAEIRPFRGCFYRQESGNPEPHRLNEAGRMLNALLNAHSICPRRFSAFRAASLAVLARLAAAPAVPELLGGPGKVVQTMFFDGNPETWPHHDAYYLDGAAASDGSGNSLVGAWIALEDIDPDAGAFYVCPGSHRLDLPENRGPTGRAAHQGYKDAMRDLVARGRLERHAPAMRRGDVLFWAARTVHGSLPTRDPRLGRRSLTAHLIPRAADLIQFQRRRKRPLVRRVDGAEIAFPKDQALLRHRLLLGIAAAQPALFGHGKELLIRTLLR